MSRPKPDRFTKRRIAEIQLAQAVRLLVEENDPVSALTLAGAAEEILGKILEAAGEPTAYEAHAAYDRSFWDYVTPRMLVTDPKFTPPDDKEIRRRLNHLRNELKHNASGKNLSVVGMYKFEAEEMLLRAISNYLRLYKKLPRRKLLWDWWDDMTL